jgi:hypothetical protein
MTKGSMKNISMIFGGKNVQYDSPTDRKFPVLIPDTKVSENAFQCLFWNVSKAVFCCRVAGKRRTHRAIAKHTKKLFPSNLQEKKNIEISPSGRRRWESYKKNKH